MKTLSLTLAGLLSAPAFAGPLEIVDSPAGEKAMLVLNPQAPARAWDGSAWSPGPTGILWQESEGSRYCGLFGQMDPVAGLVSALRCRDLAAPGGSWLTIAPPVGLTYGIYDSELSFAVTPQGVAVIDALFTDFDPATGEVELQWWNWDSQSRSWVFVRGNIPALEDIALDSRGNSACVAWTVPGSGNIQTACDWSGNRLLEQPFTVNQITAPNAEWVSGLVVTSVGFAAVSWGNNQFGFQDFETAAVLEDGSTTTGPPAQTLVLGSDLWITYNNGFGGLVAWDPWGLSQLLYAWPAQGWGIVAEHQGNIYATEQDPAGAWGPLTLVY